MCFLKQDRGKLITEETVIEKVIPHNKSSSTFLPQTAKSREVKRFTILSGLQKHIILKTYRERHRNSLRIHVNQH